jgi:hypothetical protein|tara:strand:- start:8 stop:382 length:375 start_codon:yes stop_codon:yes gene_type:complete
MVTLETQYREFLRNNRDGFYSFEEWKQCNSNNIKQPLINMIDTSQMNENEYTNNRVESIIGMLKSLTQTGDCVDGETMQYILESVGMDDQMLRQLIMSNPQSDTIDLLAEKIELSDLQLQSYKV